MFFLSPEYKIGGYLYDFDFFNKLMLKLEKNYDNINTKIIFGEFFMIRKNSRNTKGRIVSAAWKLFYDKGYENTTIEDIVWESGTSKGSFYHYFESKDALLGSLAYLFDEKYEQLSNQISDEMKSIDILLYLNAELFEMIENSVDLELLTRLFSSQLLTKGEQSLLDHNRFYYRLIKQIVSKGKTKGEISDIMSVSDIVKYYALCERSLMYDWCLSKGNYSLKDYGKQIMPILLFKLRKE